MIPTKPKPKPKSKSKPNPKPKPKPKPKQDVSERAWVGADFFRLPEEKQKLLLKTGNMLFCRTEPKDKQRLVKMLQDMGEVIDI